MPRYHGGIIWPGQSEGAERLLRSASHQGGSRKGFAYQRESTEDPPEKPPSEGTGEPCQRDTAWPKGITNDTAVSRRYHSVSC